MHQDLNEPQGEQHERKRTRFRIGMQKASADCNKDTQLSRHVDTHQLATWIVTAARQAEDQSLIEDVSRSAQIGQIVKRARRRLGMSRKTLAKSAGVSLTYIIALENGVVPSEEVGAVELLGVAQVLALPQEMLARVLIGDSNALTNMKA